MDNNTIKVKGFRLQEETPIFVAAIQGKWLLERTTPSWRINDPIQGFQRVIREGRAREIAVAVLDQKRTFPNSIVLATDKTNFEIIGEELLIPEEIKFLVVDGQHRLWAQNYSSYNALYACNIHTGLTEAEMARLFLEINDNQKRVPSSLRWDLVRLVRPVDDPIGVATAEMSYLFATQEESPLYQRIDLTGEQSEIYLKQGSLAPGLKKLLGKRSPLYGFSFEQQYEIINQYLISIKQLDSDGWGDKDSTFYKARVLRALLRLLPDLILHIKKDPFSLRYSDFLPYLLKIDESSLENEKIRAAQGSAGMKAIYDQIYIQVFNS